MGYVVFLYCFILFWGWEGFECFFAFTLHARFSFITLIYKLFSELKVPKKVFFGFFPVRFIYSDCYIKFMTELVWSRLHGTMKLAYALLIVFTIIGMIGVIGITLRWLL